MRLEDVINPVYCDENKDNTMIRTFVYNHPDIGNFLPKIYKKIDEYFPDNLGVHKEIIIDEDGGEDLLKLYVKSNESLDELLEKLDDFNDWWLNTTAFNTGKIFVDVMSL